MKLLTMEPSSLEMGSDGSCFDMWEIGFKLDSEASRLLRRKQLSFDKAGFVFRLRDSKGGTELSLVNAFRERRALALTLNDTKTAVNRLHRIIDVLVSIVIIIIWLLILGIATTKFFLVISSQLLLVVFVFGNSSLLGNKSIANYYRSPDMQDAIEYYVHIVTPPEKISALKQRILSYVDNKKDHWHPSPMIVFRDMCGLLNSIKIAMWPMHKMNHQDMGERFVRRGQLLEEIGRACRYRISVICS